MSMLTTLNTNLFFTINSWAGKSSILDTAVRFSAEYLIYILFITTAFCIGYLAYKREWRPVVLFFIGLGVSFIILFIASKIFISARPFADYHVVQLIPHPANQSFPSDHATASMALALAVLVFTRFKKTGWLLIAIACVVGFSRIVAGVHYPLDVAGGFITALIGIFAVYLIARSHPAKQAVRFNAEIDRI